MRRKTFPQYVQIVQQKALTWTMIWWTFSTEFSIHLEKIASYQLSIVMSWSRNHRPKWHDKQMLFVSATLIKHVKVSGFVWIIWMSAVRMILS